MKGLSRLAQFNEADPLLASILTNLVVEQDRITLRPGYFQMGAIAAGRPISTMIPFYGADQKFVVAAGDGLFNASGTRIGTQSYGSDQWQWTSFANLSQTKIHRRWSTASTASSTWDGTNGSLPSAHAEASDSGSGPEWFSRGSSQNCEVQSADSRSQPWRRAINFDPTTFDKILSHKNRLWFADVTIWRLLLCRSRPTTRGLTLSDAAAQRLFQARRHHPVDQTWTSTAAPA